MLDEQTRAGEYVARDPSLRVWRGPQPICWPERCGSLMRLTTSSGTEIETRPRKRRADAVGLTGLRTWIIKSTLRSSSRAAGTMMAPTSAQALKGQGLQKGVQRAWLEHAVGHRDRGKAGKQRTSAGREDAVGPTNTSAEVDTSARREALEDIAPVWSRTE